MNLDLWNKVKRPPLDALKKITGGRLSGKSDISPQWRLEVITEQFGPCGSGWYYTIDELWTVPAAGGEVFAFALVSLYYKLPDGQWSEAIPGIGGHMLLADEKSGMYSNDEAYKMAVTDALSVSMKALGVGADIYRGKFDGSKYNDVPDAPIKQPQAPPKTDLETARGATLKHLDATAGAMVLGKPEMFKADIKNAKTPEDLRAIYKDITEAGKGKSIPELKGEIF